MRTFIAASALLAVAGVAQAQYSQELGAGALDEGVQVEGDTTTANAFFMNAQGNDDDFAEFYVMRFDLAAYSGAAVQGVSIDLRHEEIFFAASGQTRLSYSADDSTDLTSLLFDAGAVGGNNGQLPASEVALFDFVDVPGEDNETQIDTIVLNDAGGLFSDIEGQGVITLILEAAEPGTAATYAGINNEGGGPVLSVTEVPAPGAAALLGLAGLTAARRRR